MMICDDDFMLFDDGRVYSNHWRRCDSLGCNAGFLHFCFRMQKRMTASFDASIANV